MAEQQTKRIELKPLGITCTSSDCENELHCFKKSRQMSEGERGRCRDCGAELVEWERVHRRELKDVNYTFQALKYELVRHHYWHKPIDQHAENHARRKGKIELRVAAQKRLAKYVGTANPYRDGMQTPTKGNIIYYAQHALACCCRTCMEYWHGIPKGEDLTVSEIAYFTQLVMLYVHERIPDLKEEGVNVPPIRRRSIEKGGY